MALTPLEQRLFAALRLCVNKKGHLDSCGHGLWLNGYTNQPGELHACDLEGCEGEGQPCTKRCLTVRQVLKEQPCRVDR